MGAEVLNKAKKLKHIICLLVIVVLISTVSAASGNTVVYVTDTGEKYHTSDCGYLSNSKHSILLRDAVEQGYTPCSVCDPPELYSTSSGNSSYVISGPGYGGESEELKAKIEEYEEIIADYEENYISKEAAAEATEDAVSKAVAEEQEKNQKEKSKIITTSVVVSLLCVGVSAYAIYMYLKSKGVDN